MFASLSFLRALFCLREKQGFGATTWRAAAILSADFKFLTVAGTESTNLQLSLGQNSI